MTCENKYCIYSKKNICQLARIEVNSLGMCEDCIIISLDSDFLEAEKERQLQEINNL
ncbi:MAG: hypothetical protein FWG87_10400 [Defluviitaleaceae bacterium]|nr:hypothetical protein [Defluviitaleaceae bacterium]